MLGAEFAVVGDLRQASSGREGKIGVSTRGRVIDDMMY